MAPRLQNQGPLPPAPSSKPGVAFGAPLPGRSSWCCGEQRPPSRCARLLWALGPSQEPPQTGAMVTLSKMRKLRLSSQGQTVINWAAPGSRSSAGVSATRPRAPRLLWTLYLLCPGHTTLLGHSSTRKQSSFSSEQAKRDPQAELQGGTTSLVARVAPSPCRELKPGWGFVPAGLLPS